MASVSRPVSPHDNVSPLKSSTDQATSTSFPAQVSEPRDSNDPLAEFYELAKAERDNDVSEYDDDVVGDKDISEDGETDDEYHGEAGPPIKRGFTCDSKVNRSEGSKNQDIIEKLQELMELHKSKPSKDDFWRGFSYSKAIGPIRNHPRRIRSYAEARSIRGVGDKTAEKIMEIIQTGGLRRIAFENTGDVEAAKIFTGIYGVGQTIAYRWYASGCRTLDDVRTGKGGVKLSPAMEIGLRFYDDINSRMPRGEAEKIFKLIKPIALSLDPKLFIEIMGSFRRGKKDCGDIDIMITRPTDDNKTHAGIVPHLLHALREAGIITEDLALPDDSHATEAIYRGLCKLPDTVDEEGKLVRRLRRRIDILSIPWQNRGAALLYYTGDDIFNRAMRFKANKMGYSLNQRGLFQGVVRDPHDRRIKTNAGNIIASETEEEIFKILGVPWQEPHERVRSQ
ncbi:hypothetical protein PILCRDRAFT_820879 [Piloderma croceum F 1598]|uniref:DNA polymerase n=1 Tax=Piloderma croceum (strain F 1598) TaxID=765440 RepID=A0A0C3B6W3_PILCF|nr:hypothetical protein PILCRDRAFT_820879 [Piloderma croceum F 1598]